MELTPFKELVKSYLDKLAKTDKLFAKTYAKSNKNIDDCCQYIIEEAKKAAKGQCSAAFKDDEVYGLAIHYYDEDDIKPKNSIKASVVVGASASKPVAPTKKRGRKPKTEMAEIIKLQPTPTENNDDFTLEIPIF